MPTPKCPVYYRDPEVQRKVFLYIVFFVIIVFYIYYHLTKFEHVTIRIKNPHLLKATGEISENLISDENGTIYKISNNLLVWYFTAAETINRLEAGKVYVVSGYGKRIPILGLYPQITKVVSV